MMVVFNPKGAASLGVLEWPADTNTFASASLDTTVKIWGLGSATAHFTLEGAPQWSRRGRVGGRRPHQRCQLRRILHGGRPAISGVGGR